MGWRRRSTRYKYAERHIREAEELSRELGGADEDVKQLFFRLSQHDLRIILDAYEQAHGKGAREYAERTISTWRTGGRHMSGLVASRLFELLPRHLPLEYRIPLIEKLWAKHAPQSEYSISFGPHDSPGTVRAYAEKHLETVVNGYTIPEPLQARFQWLAAGDSQLAQQLLNQFLLRDRQQAVEAVYGQVVVLLRAVITDNAVQGFRRDLKVGGHTVHVFLDPRATSITLTAGPPRFAPPRHYMWLAALGIIAAVILFICLCIAVSSSNDRKRPPSPSYYRYHRL